MRIVAARVDSRQLTLYLESGGTFSIPQGDYRVKSVINIIRPALEQHQTAHIVADYLYLKEDPKKPTTLLGTVIRWIEEAFAKLFGLNEDFYVSPMELGSFARFKEAVEAARKEQSYNDPAPEPVLEPKSETVSPPPAIAKADPAPKLTAPVVRKPRGYLKATARALYTGKKWVELVAFKRKSRKGWERLGFTQPEIVKILKKGLCRGKGH